MAPADQLAVRFKRDDDRYIVFCGEDRIGFVKTDGKRWNAVDTYMAWSRWYGTRRRAGAALRAHAIKDGICG